MSKKDSSEDSIDYSFEGKNFDDEMKKFANLILAIAKEGINEISVTTDNDFVIKVTLDVVEAKDGE